MLIGARSGENRKVSIKPAYACAKSKPILASHNLGVKKPIRLVSGYGVACSSRKQAIYTPILLSNVRLLEWYFRMYFRRTGNAARWIRVVKLFTSH